MNKKLELFKAGADLAVAMGIAKIVKDIVEINVTPDTKLARFGVFAGGLGVACALADVSLICVNRRIDLAANLFNARNNKQD